MTIQDFVKGKHHFFDEWYTCRQNRIYRIAKNKDEKRYKIYKAGMTRGDCAHYLRGVADSIEKAVSQVSELLKQYEKGGEE